MPLQQIYIEVTMKIQKLFNIIIHLICFCLLWEQYSAISQLLHCILRLMGIKVFSIVAVWQAVLLLWKNYYESHLHIKYRMSLVFNCYLNFRHEVA